MARKRMFSLLVVDTDEFLDMPSSTQSLYYHLGMRADDDGFVASPKKIVKLVNCSNDDLRLLIAKGFIIPFDSGIIAIRHWKLNNDLKKDRYTPNVIKLRDDEPSGYYCLDGIFIWRHDENCSIATTF